MTPDRREPHRPRPTADHPAQWGVGDIATPQDFLALLDAMRNTRKLSYRQISQRAGKGMSSSTAQDMVTGDTLPSLPKLRLFLAGCNVPPEERRRWINSWHRINEITKEASGAPPEPATAPPPLRLAPDTGADLSPARPSPPTSPDPADDPPQHRGSHRGAGLRRLRFPLLALTAFIVLIGSLTASAILMWHYRVPIEIMFAVYGLITVSVTSWMMVAQRHHPPDGPGHNDYLKEKPGIFTDPVPPAAKPVIGE